MGEHTPQAELAERLAEAAEEVVLYEFYFHNSDPEKTYQVIDFAINEEDEQVLVVYRAMYGDGIKFARPLSQWFEVVGEADGQPVTRFKRVG